MSKVAVGFLVGERLGWMALVYFKRLDCRLLAGSQGVGRTWHGRKVQSQMFTYTFRTLTPYGACVHVRPQLSPGSKLNLWPEGLSPKYPSGRSENTQALSTPYGSWASRAARWEMRGCWQQMAPHPWRASENFKDEWQQIKWGSRPRMSLGQIKNLSSDAKAWRRCRSNIYKLQHPSWG